MNAPSPSDTWRLRTADGALYGPAKFEKMILWAEEGKILPGCHLSQDGQNWIPAENIAALDLRWYIHDGGGRLRGPLNKRAAQRFIDAAPNPASLRLVSAREAGLRAPSPANETPILQGLELPEPDARKPQPPKPPKPEPDTQALRAQLAEFQDAVKSLSAELAAKDQSLATLENSNIELRENLKSAIAGRDQAEAERASLQSGFDASQSARAALEALAGEAQSEHAAARAELTVARAQLDETVASRNRLLADFAELTDLANTRDRGQAEAISRLEHDLAQARGRPSSAADELRPLLLEEVNGLDVEIEEERAALDAFKTLAAQRLAGLQERRHQFLQKINAAPGGAPSLPGAAQQSRFQNDAQVLRETHAAEMRKAEERENILQRKLRATEATLEGLRAQIANMDSRGQSARELNETIQNLKRQLAALQKQRDSDLAHFEVDRSALLERVSQLEVPNPRAASSGRDDPPASRFRFMTLKK